MQVDAIAESILKEVEEVDGALETRAFEAAVEKNIPTEATVGAEASDAAKTTTICMIYHPISKSVLNSSSPQPETKTPSL